MLQFHPDRDHLFWSFSPSLGLRYISNLIFWFGPNKAGVKAACVYLLTDAEANVHMDVREKKKVALTQFVYKKSEIRKD